MARRAQTSRGSLSRSYTAAPTGESKLLIAKRLLASPLVLTPFVLGLAIMFVFWGTAAEWTWSRLGFAWAPALLWPFAFALALRYRAIFVAHYWRYWLGSAVFVAGAIGLLSLFSFDRWWLQEATMGGYWGQVLGGEPFSQKSLGILKVIVLFALVPPIISPGLAGRGYIKGARGIFLACRAAYLWLRDAGFPAMGRALAKIPMPDRVSLRLRIWWRAITRRSEVEERPAEVPAAVVAESIDVAQPEPDYEDFAHAEQNAAPVAVADSKTPVKIFGWRLPSLELLTKPEPLAHPQKAPEGMSEQITATLAEHGLDVSVTNVRVGPRVIQFGLAPGWVSRGRDSKAKQQSGGLPTSDSVRVKVQSILAREKDLALALKTPHLRIEAPVPGEAFVGIELPNPSPIKVPIRSVMESPKFRKMAEKGGLPIALGEDTAGEAVAIDLKGLPHLLIAGSTGSGKSVCINTVITSLLLTNQPDRLRFLMVDPKRVELTPFNGIPHLIAPVITDANEVLGALQGIVAEMFRRYRSMEEIGARDIESYNRKASERMPFLVVVIDELADMMMVAAYESEQAAVRLAQLGRATGVHLVLATQRPSVNVVTGLIKANIPARAAFAVASQVDSRVVLDGVGAEKLLGKGDMLFLSQESPKPRRVQGALVQDEEVEALVDFWKEQKGPPLPPIMPTEPSEEASSAVVEADEDDDYELLDRARELSLELPRVSPSILQRKLQVGYGKAVQLIQAMEKEGVTAERVR